eukprot:7387023-Prymnesium_polylepis.2
MNPIEDEAVISHALLKMADEGAPVHLRDCTDELPTLRRAAGVSTWRLRYRDAWYTSYDEVPDDLKSSRKVMPTMFPPPAERVGALHLEHCMRVLPHFQDTGGFFIAVLEKPPAPPPPAADAAPPPAA